MDCTGLAIIADGPSLLAEVLAIVRERWRLIAIFTVLAIVVGLAHNFFAERAYETYAVVQVEPRMRDIGGPFSDVENTRRVNDALVDEVQVLQSRSVIGQVVDDLSLSIRSTPSFFPFVGAAIARSRSDDGELKSPVLGLSRYAWSTEAIVIGSMEVHEPFMNQTFSVVTGARGAYKVQDSSGNVLASGKVGETSSAGYRTMCHSRPFRS
jgi:tyrosine-protein kinase Etk/Wzc